MFLYNSQPLLLWKTKMTFHRPHRMRWDYHQRHVLGPWKKWRYSKMLITNVQYDLLAAYYLVHRPPILS